MKKSKPAKPTKLPTTSPESWPLAYCESRLSELESLYRFDIAQGLTLPTTVRTELSQLKARRYLLIHGNPQQSSPSHSQR